MNIRQLLWVLLFSSLLTAVLLGGCSHGKSAADSDAKTTAAPHKVLFYRSPMNPNVTSPVPAKDSMGMDFVPVYADAAAETGAATVHISPAVEENLGIRTTVVIRQDLPREIRTVGYIDYDESGFVRVHTRAAGWIADLPISSSGETVRPGQLLFTFYSPTLVTAEQEYVQAVASGDKLLIGASRQRLESFDVPRSEITRLDAGGTPTHNLPYYAPQGGVVQMLDARPGLYVTPDNEVMRLGVLSKVWLVAEVFERDADAVTVGDAATASFASAPDAQVHGKVDFVDTTIDPATRTLKVRVTFPNPGVALKPHMYADVTIEGQGARAVLTVPQESLIRTGDGERVIVALGGGRFRTQPVTSGASGDRRIAILSGLQSGDNVVTSGQFLIDSEANIEASLARLESGGGATDVTTGGKP